MRKQAWCFILAILFALPAPAEEKQAEPDPYHDWLTYYYMEKDAAKVPDFLKWIQESNTLEKHEGALAPMEGFLSVVFAQNPAQVENWSHSTSFTGKARELVDYAAKPPAPPESAPIKKAGDLDRAWGSYFASGDELYLKKIVDVLEPNAALDGDAATQAATRAAGTWSLGSNMTQHEAVDRFLQKESVARQGDVAATLKRTLSEVSKQREARAFPHRDGEFSAIAFVTDPAVAQRELAQAANDVIHFKEMNHAKPGDKRTVVIVFAGMALTPDYHADVTYDAQLINPAGKIYSDIKDLEGLKQRVPTRFRVFNNKAAVFIGFDSKDKPGTYKIRITLKDNVGKRTIPLATQIRMKK